MDVSAHKLAEKQDNEVDKAQMDRVVDSAEYLAANLERAGAEQRDPRTFPCWTPSWPPS